MNAPCVSTSTRPAQLDELESLIFVNVSLFPFSLNLYLPLLGHCLCPRVSLNVILFPLNVDGPRVVIHDAFYPGIGYSAPSD